MVNIKFDKRRKTNISKKELERLYEKEKWPIPKIAEKYNCTMNTISYWIWRYNIKRRTASESGILFNKREELKISKEKLYDLFINKKLNLNEIAKECNCSISSILNRLRRYNISNKFSNCKRVKFSKKELKNLYENKKLTTYDISIIYGCCQATIWKGLKEFKIKRRTCSDYYNNIPSREFLEEKYIDEGLSNWKIEEKYEYNRSTVYRLLKKYSLIKTRAEAHRIYPRMDFSGDLIEKAYLIGFKIGDLRARKVWKNGETIHVDCGSSKQEQIKLIKDLFEKYGRVWIKRNKNRKGYFQIEAYLNDSFSFLLEQKAPKWVFRDKKYFFPFLVGFSDAEGCIAITKKNQAYYSIVNQNKRLLKKIQNKLLSIGIISPKLILDSKKGTPIIDGANVYYSNKDCWSLRMHKKVYLFKLLENLEPYLKHEKKVNNLKLAKINILERNRRLNERKTLSNNSTSLYK